MLVDSVGLEPTHPEGMDLQSIATLLLCRLSFNGGVGENRTHVQYAKLILHTVETKATPILFYCKHLLHYLLLLIIYHVPYH